MAFPKPGAVKKKAVERGLALSWQYCMKRVGDRWVCIKGGLGRKYYRFLTYCMWRRQGAICPLCGKFMDPSETSFDHEAGRGMAGYKRQDAIYVRVDGKIRRVNYASHILCNGAHGSVPVSIVQPPYRKMSYLIELWKRFEEGE